MNCTSGQINLDLKLLFYITYVRTDCNELSQKKKSLQNQTIDKNKPSENKRGV